MKSIGFKNFRRFANLDPLQLGDITFFVGGNNAGKSTVVKAMMLLLDNLSSSDRYSSMYSDKAEGMPIFRLDANRIHEVHIGTFGRALHKPYPEEKQIYFEAEIGNYRFAYYITGDTESKQANANVAKIEITNTRTNVHYVFDYVNNEARVIYNELVLGEYAGEYSRMEKTQANYRISEFTARRDEIQQALKALSDAVQIARMNSELTSIERNINALKKALNPLEGKIADKDVEYIWTIESERPSSFTGLLLQQAQEILRGNSPKEEDSLDDEDLLFAVGPTKAKLSAQKKALGTMFEREARLLMRAVHGNLIEYISAHAASQKVLFSIEDKNDYMASVIREFKQCRINRGDKEFIFVTKWMKELEIGWDFHIDAISGEAYTMEITNMQENKMPLADMGMGSIQMMLLLLRLATIIRMRKGNFYTRDAVVVVVEEPEQNIHPKLQSLLTDLFVEVSEKYGFRFIIETHSEYMIRKSQVLVSKLKYESQEEVDEKCPIKTYYFPGDMEQEKDPYEMKYRTDGNFENDFGTGFYDVASDLAFQTF